MSRADALGKGSGPWKPAGDMGHDVLPHSVQSQSTGQHESQSSGRRESQSTGQHLSDHLSKQTSMDVDISAHGACDASCLMPGGKWLPEGGGEWQPVSQLDVLEFLGADFSTPVPGSPWVDPFVTSSADI